MTNSTKRICLVASGGRKPVTFRSQSPTLSRYTTHVDVNKIRQNHNFNLYNRKKGIHVLNHKDHMLYYKA